MNHASTEDCIPDSAYRGLEQPISEVPFVASLRLCPELLDPDNPNMTTKGSMYRLLM